MSQIDPDPHQPDEGHGDAASGDPTAGGKRGEIGNAPSIAADEPDDGNTYAAGGGRVAEEQDAPPVTQPGPGA